MSDSENRYKKIDEHLQEIKVLQALAIRDIRDCLRTRIPDVMESSMIKYGILSERNDYRNHVWLSLHYYDQELWITTTYMDVDPRSGNIHTQIGRIQFWKNIHCNTKGAVMSPNLRSEDGKHFMFCPENSFDPGIRLYDDDYSAVKVADAFVKFMKDSVAEF